MKTLVNVRNVEIGSGMPKICVPMVGHNKSEYEAEITSIQALAVDVVEWRMDFFEEVENIDRVLTMLAYLRESLGNMVILATFRTRQEGGEKAISKEAYVALNQAVIKSGYADLVDVELFTGDEEVAAIVTCAHEHGVKVIMSNHDFFKTPSYDEIMQRLSAMRVKGADIPKIAVMPQSNSDVLTLLQATSDMAEQADCPIITMSMAGTGVISRICGEVFGSALSFGAAKKASAPGQVPVQELRNMLEILHKSI